MDFLAGTLHIFIIYAALFVIFCLPPYTAAWARLVQRLNALRINGPRLARVFGLSAPLILLAAILIGHLFQFHKELEISFWLLFAPASFAVLPLAAAFFGAASWAAYKREIGFGDLSVLLFAYGGFGVAGTNAHDVLWCGRATEFYTAYKPGGHDLYPWVEWFCPPSPDYRIFGFFMLLQMLLGLAIGHVCFFRFLQLKGGEKRYAPLALNWFAAALLALAITLIDWPQTISPPLIHTSLIAAATAAACLLFHKSGKLLHENSKESPPLTDDNPQRASRHFSFQSHTKHSSDSRDS